MISNECSRCGKPAQYFVEIFHPSTQRLTTLRFCLMCQDQFINLTENFMREKK